MIPLIPGYAVSIHKSQGMSLDKVIINPGPREFVIGLLYTAITRCKTSRNMAFDPYPSYIRFRDMFKSKSFKERVKENERIQSNEANTINMGYL